MGNVDADPAAFQAFGHVQGGAAAAEGVQHQVAFVAAGPDDALQQGFGFLGGVAEAFFGRAPIGPISVQISCNGIPGISSKYLL